jgi:hypothetical protein
MFGRLSYVEGDPGRIDDLIVYVRTVVKPATDELAGSHGLGMWVNRTTGSALIITGWDDVTSLFESEAAVIKLRDDAAGIIGGNAIVERYQVAFGDLAEPSETGDLTRLMRLQCEPSMLAANVEWARENLIPALRAVPGYGSYVVSTDRQTGAMLSMTTFADIEAAEAGLAATEFARESSSKRGIHLLDIRDYEVAIAGIRAIPTVPLQRSVDLSATSEPVTPR